MKIVVAVRCLNEIKHIDRFLERYSFADEIVVSDGGSTDGSTELLEMSGVDLVHFDFGETVNGYFWNTDAPHMNFVIDRAKSHGPDWIIFDDMDCHPNKILMNSARQILASTENPQVNVFRLYLWGENEFFPQMNRDFNPKYTSLWAWQPGVINVYADINQRHGTLLGLEERPAIIREPAVLLHKSWNPETIQAKLDRYNSIGLPMNHPFTFAGDLRRLPEWAE